MISLPRSLSRALCTLTLLVTGVAAQSTGDVIVLADDGSGDAGTLFDAIAAAAPGDVILVREGNYAPFSVFDPDSLVFIDKPLTIVAEGAVASFGQLIVQGLAAGEEVVLRRLAFGPVAFGASPRPSMTVQQCQGTVILEDCVATGFFSIEEDEPGQPALQVSDCAGVTVTRATLRGGDGLSALLPLNLGTSAGGPAAVVSNSQVSLQHCTLEGGDGGSDSQFGGGGEAGGDGLQVQQSVVLVAGSSLTGGDGSDSAEPAVDASGGDGLAVSHPASLVRLIDVSLAGGQGGSLPGGPAPDGQPQAVSAGTVVTLPFSARGTQVSPVAREGESVQLSVSAPPGQTAEILLGFDVAYAQLSGVKGVWQLGGPLVGPIVLGSVPASGTLELAVPVGLGTLLGFDGLRVDVQGFSFGSEGFLLANPSCTVVLDPAL